MMGNNGIDPGYILQGDIDPNILETIQNGGQLTEEMQIYLAMRASLNPQSQAPGQNGNQDQN